MKINVIRLRSALHDKNKEMIKENDGFIDELNNELMNDDLLLEENAKDAVFSIIFVESGGSEAEFVKIFDKLEDPIILLSNGKNICVRNGNTLAMRVQNWHTERGYDCLCALRIHIRFAPMRPSVHYRYTEIVITRMVHTVCAELHRLDTAICLTSRIGFEISLLSRVIIRYKRHSAADEIWVVRHQILSDQIDVFRLL